MPFTFCFAILSCLFFAPQSFTGYFHCVEIEMLLERLDALEQRAGELEDQNTLLKSEIRRLEKVNVTLKERLSFYENPKNSRNSSIPPSKDENRPKRNQSLRRASGKKPGGQPGHKGKTLEMAKYPDEVIELRPEYCNSCGKSLEGVAPSWVRARQIVDIPVPRPIFTEYRTCAKTCACGHETPGRFPRGHRFARKLRPAHRKPHRLPPRKAVPPFCQDERNAQRCFRPQHK